MLGKSLGNSREEEEETMVPPPVFSFSLRSNIFYLIESRVLTIILEISSTLLPSSTNTHIPVR